MICRRNQTAKTTATKTRMGKRITSMNGRIAASIMRKTAMITARNMSFISPDNMPDAADTWMYQVVKAL